MHKCSWDFLPNRICSRRIVMEWLIWSSLGVNLCHAGYCEIQRSKGTYAVLFELNERKSLNPNDNWSKKISKVHDNQFNPVLSMILTAIILSLSERRRAYDSPEKRYEYDPQTVLCTLNSHRQIMDSDHFEKNSATMNDQIITQHFTSAAAISTQAREQDKTLSLLLCNDSTKDIFHSSHLMVDLLLQCLCANCASATCDLSWLLDVTDSGPEGWSGQRYTPRKRSGEESLFVHTSRDHFELPLPSHLAMGSSISQTHQQHPPTYTEEVFVV